MVVKDEGVQDAAGTVYSLEDGRRDQGQESTQESMAGFGQVGGRRETNEKREMES